MAEMKLLGSVMIFLGSMGLAKMYAEKISQEIRLLERLEETLELIENEIGYGKMSLPECLLWAGMQKRDLLGQSLERVGRVMLDSPEKHFDSVLEAELKSVLKGAGWTEAMNRFLEISSVEGCRDEKSQLRSVERARRYFLEELNRKKGMQKEEKKIVWCISTMGGMFVILLLV